MRGVWIFSRKGCKTLQTTYHRRASRSCSLVLFQNRSPQASFHRGGCSCLLVLFQDRIASGDALVADEHTAIGRIRDQRVYLVLRFAAKRTSEDFILMALAEHDPSMPGVQRKSRSAKVSNRPARWAKASVSAKHRKMLRL